MVDRFESEDGTKVEESGSQKVIGEESGTVSKGSYSFTVEGVTYTVNWIADENGFQATGDHIPTVAPPKSAWITRWIELAKKSEINHSKISSSNVRIFYSPFLL